MYQKLTFSDESKSSIKAELEDGSVMRVPVAPGNRHYEEIRERHLTIGDYVPPIRDRIAEIHAELLAIDMASIRPSRAINKTGNGVAADQEKLDQLEAQAEVLRIELAGLS